MNKKKTTNNFRNDNNNWNKLNGGDQVSISCGSLKRMLDNIYSLVKQEKERKLNKHKHILH